MQIVNVVSLWDLGKKVRLLKRLKKFNADVIKDGSNCLLLFESGKIIATGFKSFYESKRFVNSTYPSAKFIKIINMTAVATIRDKIDLSVLSYEPEIYPAHLWKKNKLCVVYYASGKLIITGGRSHRDLHQAYKEFREVTSIKRDEQKQIDH
ncbi:TATA-box-binding protein-like protein 1 [Tetranychus urticae]|uniref:TATA-box-binding protein-like protein 1 n=1 Tax=Tetranychus urticae TaxID=32264 RepID=UPI00077B90B4|nr:TATA-box-binding protein-like protein 1 [Tetranychus urticae]